jgi:archaemetzincin
MEQQTITIISFGYFESGFLRKIADNTAHQLPWAVHIREGHLDTSDFYNAARRQCNADDLLRVIETHYASNYTKTIGVFNVDIFIPVFKYIFGQAYLGGRSGLVSAYRLGNERYGMPADEQVLAERVSKEIVHELGHTCGLIHCHVPDCVMRQATYVEDLDQKNEGFCTDCRKQILNF